MLTIVGGTYFEECEEPKSLELYGSGLRAAAALSSKGFDIQYISCLGNPDFEAANLICRTFGIDASFKTIQETITFYYYHPLTPPEFYPVQEAQATLPDIVADTILLYGQVEANAIVIGDYVVYDPQNWVSFRDTGSSAKHLALVLNRKEAFLLSGLPEDTKLKEVGESLLVTEGAEVVVIKNGSQGACVVEASGTTIIPVFETKSVWPIGSGDIFSAVFAWKWMLEKHSAPIAARCASIYTAYYCETRVLPLPIDLKFYKEVPFQASQRNIYLAGPFFTISERWLIKEFRNSLIAFGNKVFSPYHNVGLTGSPEKIVREDLEGIHKADVILAIINGLDPGTIFEIGYANALGKKIILFAENVEENDLTMFVGANCTIVSDFSTAVYKASW